MYETYDEDYVVWVAVSTENWYQSVDATGLTVFVDAADYALYQPSKETAVRVTYSSVYVESVSTIFAITYVDACNGNILTMVRSSLDLELRFDIGADTVTTA